MLDQDEGYYQQDEFTGAPPVQAGRIRRLAYAGTELLHDPAGGKTDPVNGSGCAEAGATGTGATGAQASATATAAATSRRGRRCRRSGTASGALGGDSTADG